MIYTGVGRIESGPSEEPNAAVSTFLLIYFKICPLTVSSIVSTLLTVHAASSRTLFGLGRHGRNSDFSKCTDVNVAVDMASTQPHCYTESVLVTYAAHTAFANLLTDLTLSSLVTQTFHSLSPTPNPRPGCLCTIPLSTQPPPLRCTSINPRGKSASKMGPTVSEFIPEPGRIFSTQGSSLASV
jgi:hypothetical protein